MFDGERHVGTSCACTLRPLSFLTLLSAIRRQFFCSSQQSTLNGPEVLDWHSFSFGLCVNCSGEEVPAGSVPMQERQLHLPLQRLRPARRLRGQLGWRAVCPAALWALAVPLPEPQVCGQGVGLWWGQRLRRWLGWSQLRLVGIHLMGWFQKACLWSSLGFGSSFWLWAWLVVRSMGA